MIAIVLIALIGLASAAVYLKHRQWPEAVLVVLAAAALIGVVGDFPLPGGGSGVMSIDSDEEFLELSEVGQAAIVKLKGDGLSAAQWQDLPARPLQWKAPASEVLQLDFPRRLALGRIFSLTVSRSAPANWRLQLLAENKQVIAETAGTAQALTVQWLPPVAETMVLSARLLDAAGKLLAQGPVPLVVRQEPPLQVQGRFGAPSFDTRALNELFVNSHALVDWQVTLGKTVTRSETARAPLSRANLLVVDAAWVERLGDSGRTALLAQVAAGTPLIVLAANAADRQLWSRMVQLELKEQDAAKATGTPLALTAAPLNPASNLAGAWRSTDARVWTRSWEQGRIVWVGAGDWHRYAISEPQALGLWWQGVLDVAGVKRSEVVAWIEPQEMPLPGRRLEVCALGVTGDVTFPDLKQTLGWQRRSDKADASCVAVWPKQPGWLKMQGQETNQMYVYAKGDWPLWQKAQRRAATARYAARTPEPVKVAAGAMPAWPFAALFAGAMLGLWWRERR